MTAIRSADPGSTVLLELVDRDGTTLGTAEKLSAHRTPGHLHRAFSVFSVRPRRAHAPATASRVEIPFARDLVELLLRSPAAR